MYGIKNERVKGRENKIIKKKGLHSEKRTLKSIENKCGSDGYQYPVSELLEMDKKKVKRGL